MRAWSRLDQDSFRSALLDSELCSVNQRPSTPDNYFEIYHRVLSELADRFAPDKRVTLRRQQLALWMDDECRKNRRISRMIERKYRRSGLSEDRQAWVHQERMRHQTYRRKERDYWSLRIVNQAKQPRHLWRSLNMLIGANKSNRLPKNSPSAQQFADLFEEKVAAIRRSTGGGDVLTELLSSTEIFDQFK